MATDSPPRSAPIVPRTRSPRAVKPDDMPDEQWSLTQDLGNASIAARLASIDGGSPVLNAEEASDLLTINKKAEDAAFRRFVNLQLKLGKQIASAQASYMARRKRTATLFMAATGVSIDPIKEAPNAPAGDD